MKFRLPPLNTLRLFEAAGRQLNFKTAAQELGITPSAVSHGIQALEDWLGSALFHRSGRALALTPVGAAYLPPVAESLQLLRHAADQAAGYISGVPLHISAAPSFASRILVPRLHSFRERHPQIAVSIDTRPRVTEFGHYGMDLAIRRGYGSWTGLSAEPLIIETLVPVCSPPLLERFGNTPLAGAPLIHLMGVSEDWQDWASAFGEGQIDLDKGLKVDTVDMAIEGAVRGLGIAIGRLPFMAEELSSGALVRFREQQLTARDGYWLVAPPEAMNRSDVRLFRNWLLEELELMGATTIIMEGASAQ